MCLAIKTFYDNDRLVVSIDGLPKQSRENIAEIFLSGLVANTTIVSDSTAAPVLPEKETMLDTHVFPEGAFKGMTPAEAMSKSTDLKEQDKVCIQFAAMLDTVDAGLHASMLNAGYEYLRRRFVKCEAETYGEKLNDKQLLSFYTRYVPFLPADMKQYLIKRFECLNWNDFLFQETEVLRQAVALIIKSLQ